MRLLQRMADLLQQQQQTRAPQGPLPEPAASAQPYLVEVLNSLTLYQAITAIEACAHFGQPAAPLLHWLLTHTSMFEKSDPNWQLTAQQCSTLCWAAAVLDSGTVRGMW